MSLKFQMNSLRRRVLLVFVVMALSAALLPTAAFASSYGQQGRAYDPGPRRPVGYHIPKHDEHDDYDNHGDDHHDQDNHHEGCDDSYKVKPGDTLSEIAQHFHVSLHKLAKVNEIKNINLIYVGQRLCIP